MLTRLRNAVEYHRVYMSGKVDRTVQFWNLLIHVLGGAAIYSRTESYLVVAGAFLTLQILDFAFWYYDEAVRNKTIEEAVKERRSFT